MHTTTTSATKLCLHFLDPDTRMRAELVRIASEAGCHAEIYADMSDLLAHPPRTGIVFVRDCNELGGIANVLDRLMVMGVWLPVIAMDHDPAASRVVEAVKHGALDYLALPLRPERLAHCLAKVRNEAAAVSEERRQRIYAQQQVSTLSARERQVLEAIADGASNKQIARQLQISPRTVEIHRANMMTKMGVRHVAGAIRMKLISSGQHPGGSSRAPLTVQF